MAVPRMVTLLLIHCSIVVTITHSIALFFTETKDSKSNSIYIFLSKIPCPNPWDHNGFNIKIFNFLRGKLMDII